MEENLSYRGFTGQVEIDYEADIIHGDVVGIRDVVTFQGKTPKEVQKAFRESVDDYLEYCKSISVEPEQPKISSDL
jgi:predicted HicB family RNase H-like nuclease